MQPIPEGFPPAAAERQREDERGSTSARGIAGGAADDGSGGPGLTLEFAETEAHSRLAVLARLAPYRLIRHVIASGEPIDHESYFDRTCCAALFIDISGFSKMTEKLVNKNGLEGAEQLARHLNINLGRIVDRLTDCGADVIKFAGDAALCIFPVVEGGPDLAAQTLRATQLSLECISTLERENYVVEGIRLTAHSGLGCGEATGFFAGGAKPAHLADARTEYTPIGAPMTQIASSEPAAGDGETVVSPECWALIGHMCNGSVVVDAQSQEKNYLVTSIKPEFTLNLDDGASGGIIDELQALSAAEASAVADQITVVVPEAVRAHLTDLVPGAIPNVAEFRSVTVLFSRLTGLDYSRGQSELQKVQRIVRLVQETIYKYGGQLMRFSVDDKGAVVLGVFGLPPSNQDDPVRRTCTSPLPLISPYSTEKSLCDAGAWGPCCHGVLPRHCEAVRRSARDRRDHDGYVLPKITVGSSHSSLHPNHLPCYCWFGRLLLFRVSRRRVEVRVHHTWAARQSCSSIDGRIRERRTG